MSEHFPLLFLLGLVLGYLGMEAIRHAWRHWRTRP